MFRPSGGTSLKSWLANILGFVAALSLSAAALPCAPAMAMEADQQAAQVMASVDAGAEAVPCDHAQMPSQQTTPDEACTSGVACYAVAGHLSGQLGAAEPAVYAVGSLGLASGPPLRSRPPDPTLRPPKHL